MAGALDKILIFLGMALVTFLTRYTMIALFGHGLSPRLQRWLNYVPAAVLSALIAPAALAPQGKIALGLPAAALMAGILAAFRTRNVFWTILAGLAVFWLGKLIFPGL
jgi:branched-subunit amino acid transport protein